jgi:hypothetical protein
MTMANTILGSGAALLAASLFIVLSRRPRLHVQPLGGLLELGRRDPPAAYHYRTVVLDEYLRQRRRTAAPVEHDPPTDIGL